MLTKLKVQVLEKYRTQAHFAACCGRGENWISRIVQERDVPSVKDKSLICRKLGIENPDDYFGTSHKPSLES
jgi:hypothetical protein